MESFWTAETLKYYYLIFAEPNLVSLDEYVLCVPPRNLAIFTDLLICLVSNTEAHPFKRP